MAWALQSIAPWDASNPVELIKDRHRYRRGGKKDQVADEQRGDDTGKDHTGRYRPLNDCIFHIRPFPFLLGYDVRSSPSRGARPRLRGDHPAETRILHGAPYLFP